MEIDHRRRLPHVYPAGKRLFLTWHLYGSLPHGRYPPPGKLNAGQAFVWIDRYLDTTREGPLHLARAAVASVVEKSILYSAQELRNFDCDAYVIMPDHVHLLVAPRAHPSRFMQTLKGYTSREANRILDRTGQPFWQAESYDHWVLDDAEGCRIKAYIENNPVKAGLAGSPEEYRWSSAWRR